MSIRCWLVIPTSLVPPCLAHWHILPTVHHYRSKGLCQLGVYISPLVACRVPVPRTLAYGYKGSRKTPAWLIHVYSVIVSIRALPSVVESNLWSWQQLGFGGFHGTSLVNNSIRCNSTPVLEALFGDKNVHLGLGALSPPLFVSLI